MPNAKVASEKPVIRWQGNLPRRCELCAAELKWGFIHGLFVKANKWHPMCSTCHITYGAGIGPGRGQRFNHFGVKVEG